MKLKHLVLGLATATLASSVLAANRPAGYVTICTENKTCSVAANTNVAFGRADQFFYKVLSGSFVCSSATFGGRIAGGTNECSIPSGSGSSSSSSSSSSSTSSSSTSSSSSSSSTSSSSTSSSSTSSSSTSSSSTSSSSTSSSSTSSSSTSSSSTSSSSGGPVDPPAGLSGFAAIPAFGLNTTTGGAGGRAVKVNNLTDLRLLTDSNEKLIIFIDGVINMSGMVPLRSDKTIIGLPGSKLTGGGFEIYKRQNIIIRNVTFEDAPDDSLKINQNTHHVWVDHCTFSDGATADPDGESHDGLFDITRQTSHITISYNHFKNHNKTMLIGHSDSASGDTGYLKTTIHHNFFDGTMSRHPRLRFGEVHVYNNYYLNNVTYGATSTMEGKLVMEGNYFKNVPFPSLVGYAESGPGDIVQRNNILDNSGAFQTRGTAFNPASYYSYTLDDPSVIPSKVPANAGVGKIDPWAAAGVAPF